MSDNLIQPDVNSRSESMNSAVAGLRKRFDQLSEERSGFLSMTEKNGHPEKYGALSDRLCGMDAWFAEARQWLDRMSRMRDSLVRLSRDAAEADIDVSDILTVCCDEIRIMSENCSVSLERIRKQMAGRLPHKQGVRQLRRGLPRGEPVLRVLGCAAGRSPVCH